MRRAFLALCVAALAGSAFGQTAVEECVLLQTETARDTWYVHEPVRVTLRILIEARFRENRLAPMFRRELDLPVQLRASWLDELPGALKREPERPSKPIRLALNGNETLAARAPDRVIDGRTFRVAEIERTFLPQEPGELVLSAPEIRLLHAEQFREDFLSGRVPVEPRWAVIEGPPHPLRVLALPEEGRPAGFSGAVGRFRTTASADPREVRANETFALTLRIEGEGNFEFFGAPRLDDLDGFHVYGMLDEHEAGGRTIVYDVAPLTPAVTRLPPVPFPCFDTREPAGYRTLLTEPIPLVVRPDPSAPPPQAGETPARASGNAVYVVLALTLGAALLAGLGWRRLRRRREPDEAAAAAALFLARCDEPDADVATLLAEYLAARLGCPSASVIAPDLPARLEQAGIPDPLAARTATMLEALTALRYGAQASGSGAAAEARSLVDALEEAFADSS